MENGRTQYPDIFDHPRHVSTSRQAMSRLERAAQFAPFAALRGYDDLIRDASAAPEEKKGPDEYTLSEWNYLLQFLFQEDEAATFRCADGQEHAGRIVRYDGLSRQIVLDTGERLCIDDLTGIASPAFDRAAWQEEAGEGQ